MIIRLLYVTIFEIQNKYVNVQNKYVNVQNKYVNIQNKYVNVQNKYVNVQSSKFKKFDRNNKTILIFRNLGFYFIFFLSFRIILNFELLKSFYILYSLK